jgi:hypothetical protein
MIHVLPAIMVTYSVCTPHLILHMAHHPVVHMAPHMVFQMELHMTLHMALHMVLLCKWNLFIMKWMFTRSTHLGHF